MDWSLTQIRAKIRKLTGRPDEEALAVADLDNYINHFYQNVFPLEALPPELKDWFTQNTSNTEESYAVDEKYLALKEPFTIAGYPINYYLNSKAFYRKFPETQSYTKAQPTDVLFFGQALLFRPPPDAIYQFKAQTILRANALTLATDKPPNQLWGPVIAYGSAIDIKQENEEDLGNLVDLYDFYLARIVRQNLIQLGTQRSIPRF
jgi:hypothetical protein